MYVSLVFSYIPLIAGKRVCARVSDAAIFLLDRVGLMKGTTSTEPQLSRMARLLLPEEHSAIGRGQTREMLILRP